MSHSFLIRPTQLNQAFESKSSSGGGGGNEITRRSFIKRTGGATVATLMTWNLAIQHANAQNSESSFSGSYSVYAYAYAS